MTAFTLRRTAGTAAVLAAALGLAHGAAHAAVANGDFAAGLAGWTSTGNTGADASSFFGPPAAPAAAQGVVGTFATSSFLFGGAAVGAGALESALGLGAGALSGLGALGGSALSQTFTAAAGERLRFDWKLMSDEPQSGPSNDTAFLVLDGAFTPLASVHTAVLLGSSGSPMADETAYKSFTSGPLAAGSHTVAFGVFDAPDAFGASALAVTNIATAVPEPATYALLLAGLLALPRMARRRDGP